MSSSYLMQYGNMMLPLHYCSTYEDLLAELSTTYLLKLVETSFPSICLTGYHYCREDQKQSILKSALRSLMLEYKEPLEIMKDLFRIYVRNRITGFSRVVDFLNAKMNAFGFRLTFQFKTFEDIFGTVFQKELLDLRAIAYLYDEFFVRQVAQMNQRQRTTSIIQQLRKEGVQLFLPLRDQEAQNDCDERTLAVALQYQLIYEHYDELERKGARSVRDLGTKDLKSSSRVKSAVSSRVLNPAEIEIEPRAPSKTLVAPQTTSELDMTELDNFMTNRPSQTRAFVQDAGVEKNIFLKRSAATARQSGLASGQLQAKGVEAMTRHIEIEVQEIDTEEYLLQQKYHQWMERLQSYGPASGPWGSYHPQGSLLQTQLTHLGGLTGIQGIGAPRGPEPSLSISDIEPQGAATSDKARSLSGPSQPQSSRAFLPESPRDSTGSHPSAEISRISTNMRQLLEKSQARLQAQPAVSAVSATQAPAVQPAPQSPAITTQSHQLSQQPAAQGLQTKSPDKHDIFRATIQAQLNPAAFKAAHMAKYAQEANGKASDYSSAHASQASQQISQGEHHTPHKPLTLIGISQRETSAICEIVKVTLSRLDGMKCRIEALLQHEGQQFTLINNSKPILKFTEHDLAVSRLLQNGVLQLIFNEQNREVQLLPEDGLWMLKQWFSLE